MQFEFQKNMCAHFATGDNWQKVLHCCSSIQKYPYGGVICCMGTLQGSEGKEWHAALSISCAEYIRVNSKNKKKSW